MGEEAIKKHGEGLKAEAHAAQGNPDDVILATAVDVGADLIVVGSKGMRGARRYLGSVPNSVAHARPLRGAGRQDRLRAAPLPTTWTRRDRCRRAGSAGRVRRTWNLGSGSVKTELLRRVDRPELRRRHADVRPRRRRPRVDFLAGLAAGGAALELGIGTGRIALPLSERGVRGARDRPVPRHGGAAAGEAGGRRHRRHARRLRVDPGGRVVPARLSRLQHHREPDDPGRAGGVLLQRGGTPGARRVLRD